MIRCAGAQAGRGAEFRDVGQHVPRSIAGPGYTTLLARDSMSKPCLLTMVIASQVAMACSGSPDADTATEEDAVRQRYADWVAAENRRDLAVSVSFLALDAIIQAKGADAMRDLEAAREVWRRFFEIPYSTIEDVEPRTVVVASSGDLACDAGN